MKKLLAILLTLMILFAFSACDEGNEQEAAVNLTPTPTVENQTGENEPTPTLSPENLTPTADPTITTTTAPTKAPTPTPTVKAHQHSWGDWKKETKAYINKKGTDKRVCSTCKATETRDRTACAIHNSFYDGGYQYVLSSNNNLTAFNIMGYACHELHQYMYKPTKRTVILNELTKYFDMDDKMKNDVLEDMKWYEYNEATDEITLSYSAESGDYFLKGYKHLGGNKYVTYYSFTNFSIFDEDPEQLYKIEVEYNREQGKPNKFVSVYLVDSIPSDIIAPASGEWIEE